MLFSPRISPVQSKPDLSAQKQSRPTDPDAELPTGKVAILLREKSAKLKKLVNVICLYDKKSGKESIAEYQWLGQ